MSDFKTISLLVWFFPDITVHFQHFVINQKALHFTENKIQWNQMFSFSTLAPSLLVSLTMLCLVTLCIFLCIFVQVQKRLLIQILTSQIDRRDYNLTGGTSCSRIIIMYILKSQWKLMYVLIWLREIGSKLNCWASAVFTTIENCISVPSFLEDSVCNILLWHEILFRHQQWQRRSSIQVATNP